MFDPKKLKLRHLAFSFLVSYPNRKVEWTPQCLSSREQSIPQRFSTLFTPLVLFTRLPNLLCLILKSKAAILLLLSAFFLFFSFFIFHFSFFPFLLLPPISVFPFFFRLILCSFGHGLSRFWGSLLESNSGSYSAAPPLMLLDKFSGKPVKFLEVTVLPYSLSSKQH